MNKYIVMYHTYLGSAGIYLQNTHAVAASFDTESEALEDAKQRSVANGATYYVATITYTVKPGVRPVVVEPF